MKTEPNDPIGKSTQVLFTPQGRLQETHFDGMTMRQYYAGLAMQGILSSAFINPSDLSNEKGISELAVTYSDALIRELNKTQP
jgi:hypothetical protein